jgi:hypothetical protein
MTVIHAVGPDFRKGTLRETEYTSKPGEYYKGVKDAVERLANTYGKIFTEYVDHKKTNDTDKLQLLPVLPSIFEGPFKDYNPKPNHMPIITYLAIVKAINNNGQINSNYLNTLKTSDVKLYIYDANRHTQLGGHEKYVNLYKLAFGFPIDDFGVDEATHPTLDEIKDYACIISFCNAPRSDASTYTALKPHVDREYNKLTTLKLRLKKFHKLYKIPK